MDVSREESLLLRRCTKDSLSDVSVRSKTPPPEFPNKPPSPGPSEASSGFVSLKSEAPPLNFSNEPVTKRSELCTKDSLSDVSVRSKTPPPEFPNKPPSPGPSEASSGFVSLKSEAPPLNFSIEPVTKTSERRSCLKRDTEDWLDFPTAQSDSVSGDSVSFRVVLRRNCGADVTE
ncbi:titin-like isoform X2 [Boleophthalmus pectinirostris]|uniref:titin-like isoform X2 n=1 Tax=Boleophthalmus pectinirostris TaxID=150288 RepID=UPI002430079C|nr:titin-like isoform X2 [Boleophthalmus pectinirostris]